MLTSSRLAVVFCNLYSIMVSMKKAIVAFGCVASSLAVDLVVSSAGGNVTGSKGHPFGYGFLHEV